MDVIGFKLSSKFVLSNCTRINQKKGVMMKKVLKILLALSMVTCLNCFLSCSDIETSSANVTDISKNVTFRSLFQQGYMGGSILYNPCDESSGQLAPNVTVAIRLGHVSKKLVEDDEYT